MNIKEKILDWDSTLYVYYRDYLGTFWFKPNERPRHHEENGITAYMVYFDKFMEGIHIREYSFETVDDFLKEMVVSSLYGVHGVNKLKPSYFTESYLTPTKRTECYLKEHILKDINFSLDGDGWDLRDDGLRALLKPESKATAVRIHNEDWFEEFLTQVRLDRVAEEIHSKGRSIWFEIQ